MSVESARRVTKLILAKCVARARKLLEELLVTGEKATGRSLVARFAGPAQLGECRLGGV